MLKIAASVFLVMLLTALLVRLAAVGILVALLLGMLRAMCR